MIQSCLQFAVWKELGEPVRYGAPGEAVWPCPFHADHNPSFKTLPSIPGRKDRWYCHAGCGIPGSNQPGGDLADFLRLRYPHERWPERQERIKRLEQEFAEWQRQHSSEYPSLRGQDADAERGPGTVPADDTYTLSSREQIDRCLPVLRGIDDYVASLECPDFNDRDTLYRYTQRVIVLCSEHGVSPLSLAWVAGMEAEHIAECGTPQTECQDPDCPNIYCRIARGELAKCQ
jgi:hypothetical protein